MPSCYYIYQQDTTDMPLPQAAQRRHDSFCLCIRLTDASSTSERGTWACNPALWETRNLARKKADFSFETTINTTIYANPVVRSPAEVTETPDSDSNSSRGCSITIWRIPGPGRACMLSSFTILPVNPNTYYICGLIYGLLLAVSRCLERWQVVWSCSSCTWTIEMHEWCSGNRHWK